MPCNIHVRQIFAVKLTKGCESTCTLTTRDYSSTCCSNDSSSSDNGCIFCVHFRPGSRRIFRFTVVDGAGNRSTGIGRVPVSDPMHATQEFRPRAFFQGRKTEEGKGIEKKLRCLNWKKSLTRMRKKDLDALERSGDCNGQGLEMRRWLILGVRTGLSTLNPNFSKADIIIEIRIYRFNN